MRFAIVGLALLSAIGTAASAQSLTVSGSPGVLTVSIATAGGQPASVSNTATAYTVSVHKTATMKITGQLDSSMPLNVSLRLSLAPSTGATSAGLVSLDTIGRDLLTHITNQALETHGITYQLTATVAAGVVQSSFRTITLTLVTSP